MARAVDEYLMDQTDPVRIEERKRVEAARKENERREKEAEKLRRIAGNLSEQILRLENLLKQTEYLPEDVESYKKFLVQGKQVRDNNNPQSMRDETESLAATTDVLQKYVGEKKSEARAKMWTGVWSFTWKFIILMGIGVFLYLRWRTYQGLKRNFYTAAKSYKNKVTNAGSKYFDLQSDRITVLELADVVGATKELYDLVTKEADEIYMGIRAIEAHLDLCVYTARKLKFWNFKPILEAMEQLEGEVVFDTEKLNKDDLFGTETKVIRIVLKQFLSDLDSRFKKMLEGWNKLIEACQLRNKTAEELFPHAKLTEMLSLIAKEKISECWLNEHPLIGDDDSDQKFYTELNDLRKQDPLAFATRIQEVQDFENTISRRLDMLIGMTQQIKTSCTVTDIAYDIIVDPDDDPKITLEIATRAKEKFEKMLQKKGDISTLEAQMKKTIGLFVNARDQQSAISYAITGASIKIQEIQERKEKIQQKSVEAERRFQQCIEIHVNADAGKFIENGDAYCRSAERDLEKAERQVSEKRFVNALRNAQQAEATYESAHAMYTKAIHKCNELDEQKAEYERKMEQIESLFSSKHSLYKKYGGRGSLKRFELSRSSSGAVNYELLLSEIASYESMLDSEVRSVKRRFDDEQRRIREEEEAEERRRARVIAEERRRRSSYSSSSYSSSSGSSWGSSDSSSSGSSWGGGGSSSSGGGW